MALVTLPRQYSADINGAPRVGARMFVYDAGTNNIRAAYTSKAYTIAHSQPIVSVEGGIFPVVEIDPADGDYKLVIQDDQGVEVYTADNITPTIDTLTSQGIGTTLDSLKRSQEETVAGVTPLNYAFEPYDIRRYWSGSGSIDQAVAAALAVCGSAGGRIRIPAGQYTSSSQWNLNQKQGIIIEGDGMATGGANNATIITYTGTGSSPWILMTSAFGCQIRNLTLKHSSASFTGPMVKIGNDGAHNDSFECSLVDVLMDAGANTAYHLDLDKAIVCEFTRCHFYGGAVSVKGQAAAGGSYSNEMRFQSCQWVDSAAIPVNYGGQAWTFTSCNFQQLANGQAGAFQALGTTPCSGLSFHGCWFGDVTADGGVWITVYGPAFVATGNYITGSAGSIAINLNSVAGAHITGNVFASFNIALSLTNAQTKGLVFSANNFMSVTTPLSAGAAGDGVSSIVNPNQPMVGASGGLAPFFASGVQGWEYTPNGHLEVWGQKNITAGTGATLTYSTEVSNFPGFSAVYNVQVSALSPGASVTNVYASALGTTSVAVNANGTGTTGVCWRVKGKG